MRILPFPDPKWAGAISFQSREDAAMENLREDMEAQGLLSGVRDEDDRENGE